MPPTTPIPSLSQSLKIGFIVPSSNTAVETLTISILNTLNQNTSPENQIIPLFTRIRVLTLSTSPSSASQFSQTTLNTAAQLLSDSEPQAILWNGTSGMFIGGDLQTDQDLASSMSEASGIPCSTNTIATIAALEHFNIKDISIAVPYTPDLTSKLDEFFTKEGYKVHKALCMDETPKSNIEIAKCSAESIKEVVRKSVTKETKAVLVACTNWPGTALADELEKELGVLVLDSIAVTAWYGLRMVGVKGVGNKMAGWGKLLESL